MNPETNQPDTQQPTLLSDYEYMMKDIKPCPACGSEDLAWGTLEVQGDHALQEVSCACGASWNDVYDLSGYSGFNDVDGEARDQECYDDPYLLMLVDHAHHCATSMSQVEDHPVLHLLDAARVIMGAIDINNKALTRAISDCMDAINNPTREAKP